MHDNPRVQRSLDWLGRYEDLLDDGQAFRDALEQRPPVDLLVPPGRAQVEECAHFLDCLETRRAPLTDGAAGLQVLQILHGAQHSLMTNGRPVALKLRGGAAEPSAAREEIPPVVTQPVATAKHEPVRSS